MELLNEIWQTARRNKLRTTLTGFAVAWGIFMLIFLLGAGNGLINAQTDRAKRFLANSMMIYGGTTSKPFQGMKEGRDIRLEEQDLQATRNDFQVNIDEVGAVLTQYGISISLGKDYVSGSLKGVYPNHFDINKNEMLYGRFINELDIRENRKVVVLSLSHAKELAKNYAALVGKYVNVGAFAFKVVGIYKNDESRQNNDAFTSFTTIRKMYGRGNDAGDIEFSFHGLDTEQANEQFEKKYRQRINLNHQAAPDDESSVWIWNRYTQNLQMNSGLGMVRTALWLVGLFTLLSGIVGVSNIMLITVKERTHEFGIRKAIGASPWDIMKLILAESVTITAFFGYVGMLLGMFACTILDKTVGQSSMSIMDEEIAMFVNPTVGLDVAIEATLVLIIAGSLAGLFPARKASRVRPIEALRAE